jgi:prepilin-type N-terminal cleavage/methylation domain-containing protein
MRWRRGRPDSKGGFTLIESMVALLIFSLGVLMVLNLSGALSTQLTRGALRSQVTSTLKHRLDSLQLVPYDSLTVGTVSDTLHLYGRVFDRRHRILQAGRLVREIEVTVEAQDGTGPSLTASTFVKFSW